MVKIIFFDIDGTLIDIDADDMSDKTKLCSTKTQRKQNFNFCGYWKALLYRT